MMIQNKTTWRKVKLGEILEITSSKRIFMSEYKKFGVPFYRGKEIIEKYNGAKEISTPLYISEEKFSKIENKFGAPKKDDILLSSVGTLGVPYLIKSGEKFYFKDGNLTWFRNYFDDVNPMFIYYWLTSRIGKSSILASSIGSSQQALTIDGLKKVEINLPKSVSEQKNITDILSAFDDKIELNNKISKNLEQTAQAIFKEWFVKFKFSRLRQGYGGQADHEKVKMVDSELGKIPEGWRIKSWGDLEGVSVAGDWGENISSDVCAESVYILRGTDIPALKTGSKGECPIRYLAKESLQKRKLKPGDIVVEISGGSKDQPTGRSLYITEDILKRFELPLVCTSFCRLVRSSNVLSSILMFLHLDRLYKTKKIWNYQLQSTGISNFQYGQFREYEKLIVPPPEIQEIVTDVLISCIQYSHRNENQKLAALRDLLLPKLMSGEIRV